MEIRILESFTQGSHTTKPYHAEKSFPNSHRIQYEKYTAWVANSKPKGSLEGQIISFKQRNRRNVETVEEF